MTTKMVRRRGRARKLNVAPDINAIQNIETGAVGGPSPSFLEDKYFASPKRKDCKIENGENCLNKVRTAVCVSKPTGEIGRTKEVLQTAHSQTKTIDNFFKASSTIKSSKTDISSPSISPVPDQPPHALTNGKHSPEILDQINNVVDVLFDLSDDTDDSSTDLSDECHISSRQEPAHIDDSDSGVNSLGAPFFAPSRSSTENIFLQEPVLTLNVDKSPNQASSIKINKSLEIEPIFSSPPSGVTVPSLLNGKFSTVVSWNKSPSKRDSIDFSIKSNIFLLNIDDNSSCDSGVAFTPLDNNNLSQNSNHKRKPATPHRILCPSPIKSATTNQRILSSGAIKTIKSPSRKTSQSPRKRHSKKSRRKLPQLKQTDSHKPDNHRADLNVENDEDDDQRHQNEQEIENLTDKTLTTQMHATNKLVLNSAINPTAKQNTNNNNFNSNGSGIIINNHIVRKGAAAQSKLKNQSQKTQSNRDIGEFFPVRRSVRKTKTVVKEEMMRDLENAIIEERSEGLKIAHFEGKGRGIIANRRFYRGEFVVEYVGDLIDMIEASEREQRYALDENAGCYMYYFKHKNQQYCIDATIDTGKLGRLVNHSRTGNLVTKVVVVKTRPHLILIAKDDIEAGEELTYDYGDRSKEALLHHPWLAF